MTLLETGSKISHTADELRINVLIFARPRSGEWNVRSFTHSINLIDFLFTVLISIIFISIAMSVVKKVKAK